jgi:hypothetical protein
MDPDKTLDEIRQAVRRLTTPTGEVTFQALDDVRALVDNIEALDEWLTGGGFLPDEWSTPSMCRFRVVRVWEIEALDTEQAMAKAVIGDHGEVRVTRLTEPLRDGRSDDARS